MKMAHNIIQIIIAAISSILVFCYVDIIIKVDFNTSLIIGLISFFGYYNMFSLATIQSKITQGGKNARS